jgi:hypothetical protein
MHFLERMLRESRPWALCLCVAVIQVMFGFIAPPA